MSIIALNEKYIDRLANVDFKSEHQIDSKFKLLKSKYKSLLQGRFKNGQELFFGYIDNNILKGYITIKMSPFISTRKCELYWLVVNKNYQDKGVGTKLLNYIEKYVKRKGVNKIFLYTNKLMKKTRSFYEKNNYKLVKEYPNFYTYDQKRYNTAVLYVKKW